MEHKLSVVVNSPLPDYRLFSAFIWGDSHSVDSDGDSYNPASNTWSYLYVGSRELHGQNFEIHQVEETSLVFEVSSENELMARRAAFFLVKETNGQIHWADGMLYRFDFLSDMLGEDFDLSLALQRADESIWRKSTLENPYPNL